MAPIKEKQNLNSLAKKVNKQIIGGNKPKKISAKKKDYGFIKKKQTPEEVLKEGKKRSKKEQSLRGRLKYIKSLILGNLLKSFYLSLTCIVFTVAVLKFGEQVIQILQAILYDSVLFVKKSQ